jgi:excisionase family DNA binding protein
MTTKPIAVPALDGFRMIGVSKSKGYELIAAREIETFKVGRATRIPVASLEAFVARQLASRPMAA